MKHLKLLLLLAVTVFAVSYPHKYLLLKTSPTSPVSLTDADSTYGEPPLGKPPSNGYVLSSDTAGVRSWVPNSGGGAVSVGLSMPDSVFTVTGSPVTGTGTLTTTFKTQTANKVLASPNGSTGLPAFRAFLPGDISFLTDSITAARTYTLSRIHDSLQVERAFDTATSRAVVHDSLGSIYALAPITWVGRAIGHALSGASAGTYGNTVHSATITVNTTGHITAIGEVDIAFPVTSVFGRTGAVLAQAGDYTAAQVGATDSVKVRQIVHDTSLAIRAAFPTTLPPTSHETTHRAGGSDQLNLTNIFGGRVTDAPRFAGMTLTGDLVTQQDFRVGSSSTDGNDQSATSISGGGASSNTRGSFVLTRGNERPTSGGTLTLSAGDATAIQGNIEFQTSGATQATLLKSGEFNISSGSLRVGSLSGMLKATGGLVSAATSSDLPGGPYLGINSTTIPVSNFGKTASTANSFLVSTNNRGLAMQDSRGLSWRGGLFSTDTFWGLYQDATASTSFKPFIIGDGRVNSTWLVADPLASTKVVVNGGFRSRGTTTLDSTLTGIAKLTAGVVGTAAASDLPAHASRHEYGGADAITGSNITGLRTADSPEFTGLSLNSSLWLKASGVRAWSVLGSATAFELASRNSDGSAVDWPLTVAHDAGGQISIGGGGRPVNLTNGSELRVNGTSVISSTRGGSFANLSVTGTTTLNTSLTGIAKLTAGVVGTAVAGDFPTLNQNTTGSAATLTTARTIATTGDVTGTATSFNGSANISIPTTVTKINGVALSGLSTGLLKNTTGTGTPSIAVAADLPGGPYLGASSATVSVDNFGKTASTAYSFPVSTNNRGLAMQDSRGLSWRGGLFSTDTFWGIYQDAASSTSFKPFIVGDGRTNSTWIVMDPLATNKLVVNGGFRAKGTTTLDSTLTGIAKLTAGVVGTAVAADLPSHASLHEFGGADPLAGQNISGLRIADKPKFTALTIKETSAPIGELIFNTNADVRRMALMTGNNANGGGLAVNSYDDAGAFRDTRFYVPRSNTIPVEVTNGLTVLSGTTTTGVTNTGNTTIGGTARISTFGTGFVRSNSTGNLSSSQLTVSDIPVTAGRIPFGDTSGFLTYSDKFRWNSPYNDLLYIEGGATMNGPLYPGGDIWFGTPGRILSQSSPMITFNDGITNPRVHFPFTGTSNAFRVDGKAKLGNVMVDSLGGNVQRAWTTIGSNATVTLPPATVVGESVRYTADVGPSTHTVQVNDAGTEVLIYRSRTTGLRVSATSLDITDAAVEFVCHATGRWTAIGY